MRFSISHQFLKYHSYNSHLIEMNLCMLQQNIQMWYIDLSRQREFFAVSSISMSLTGCLPFNSTKSWTTICAKRKKFHLLSSPCVYMHEFPLCHYPILWIQRLKQTNQWLTMHRALPSASEAAQSLSVFLI